MKRFVWRISILVLAFTSLLSYSSMARSQSEITLQSPEEHGRLSYDYDTMFAFVRKFLTGDRGKRVQNKLLKKVFAEELLISEELQQRYGFPDRLKEMSVQQFMILLQHNPDYWPRLAELLTLFPDKTDDTEEAKARSKAAMKELHKMIEDSGIKEWFAKVNKPTEPFELRLPRNKAGYSNLQFFATHERKYLDGTTKPADNMIEVLRNFLGNEKVKQISGNVYDFDLEEFVEILIEAKKQGKEVYFGVDNDVVHHKEDLAKAIKSLREAGYTIVNQEKENTLDPEVRKIRQANHRKKKNVIYLVDATGLNHQKMIAINWDYPEWAAVWLASMNLSKSGSHPRGDLGNNLDVDSKFAIPNANHVATMNSHVLSVLLRHQMLMMFDMGLRGTELPLSGTFKVYGERPRGLDYRPYIEIAFAPAGGLRDISMNLIVEHMWASEGPFMVNQFVYALPELNDEFYKRAWDLQSQGKDFNFWFVGDRSFAMRDYSQALDMSGLSRIKDDSGTRYVVEATNPWNETFGEGFLADKIFVAPEIYKSSYKIKDPVTGGEIEIAGKLHHKMLIFGGADVSDKEPVKGPFYKAVDGKYYQDSPYGIAMMAQSNNLGRTTRLNTEQSVAFADPIALREAWGISMHLIEESGETVTMEANARNARGGFEEVENRGSKRHRKILEDKKKKRGEKLNPILGDNPSQNEISCDKSAS